MKLAVLADIHGNFQALQAVAAHVDAWRPDQVVIAGDLVNRGPQSLDCWQFARQRAATDGWLILSGNHEDYVIDVIRRAIPPDNLEYEFYRAVYWVSNQLGRAAQDLLTLPDHLDLPLPGGASVHFTHASRLGKRDGIYPTTFGPQLRAKIAPAPTIFCAGHTHWPLVKRLDHTLIVNVGSAGLPFDRDCRPSYAQIWQQNGGWHARIVRVNYDRAQAAQAFFETGYVPEGGPITRLILYELNHARSLLYGWTKAYQARIFAGEVTVEQAVNRFLADL